MPQDEYSKRILAERASYLKKKQVDQSATEQKCHYVRFKLGEAYYGIPFHYIKEVMLNILPTKVPHTPNYIAGIINRNGVLLSLLDLKPFFHISSAEDTPKAHLLVVSALKITLAILADNIENSDTYSPTTLDAPLTTEDAIKPKYLLGLHQGKTAILNIEALVASLQSPNITSKENPI